MPMGAFPYLALAMLVLSTAFAHSQQAKRLDLSQLNFVEIKEESGVESAMTKDGKVACYCHGDPSTWFAAQSDGWERYKDAKMEEHEEKEVQEDDVDEGDAPSTSWDGLDAADNSAEDDEEARSDSELMESTEGGVDVPDEDDDDGPLGGTVDIGGDDNEEMMSPVSFIQLASAMSDVESKVFYSKIKGMDCKCLTGKSDGPPVIDPEGAQELNTIVGLDDDSVNDIVDEMECKNADPYANNLGGWTAFMKRYIETSHNKPVSIAMRKKAMSQDTSPEFRQFVGRMERLEGMPTLCLKVVNSTMNGTASHNMTTEDMGSSVSAPPDDDKKVLPQDKGAVSTLAKAVAAKRSKGHAGSAQGAQQHAGTSSGGGGAGDGGGGGAGGGAAGGGGGGGAPASDSAPPSSDPLAASTKTKGGSKKSNLLGPDPAKCFGHDEVGKFLENIMDKSLRWKDADPEKLWGDCLFWSRWVKEVGKRIKMFSKDSGKGETRALDILKCICPSAVELEGTSSQNTEVDGDDEQHAM